jgi:regulator of sigma D
MPKEWAMPEKLEFLEIDPAKHAPIPAISKKVREQCQSLLEYICWALTDSHNGVVHKGRATEWAKGDNFYQLPLG